MEPRLASPSHVDDLGLTMSEKVGCNIYEMKNTTYILHGDYGLITENLIINLGGWILLLILFTLIRWRAGDLNSAVASSSDQRTFLERRTHYNLWMTTFFAEVHSRPEVEDDMLDPLVHTYDNWGALSWLKQIFTLRNNQILRRCGPDAEYYLTFQLWIIGYLVVVCILCLAGILPANFSGDLQGDENNFGHTTISNLNPKSHLLWIHVLFMLFFMVLAIGLMRRYTRNIRHDYESVSKRHILIRNIPESHCDRNSLLRHFEEAFPSSTIVDIQFCYDVRKLYTLECERDALAMARKYCEDYNRENETRLRMKDYVCSRICPCGPRCGCPTVDAQEHYTEAEQAVVARVDRERNSSLEKPLGIVFISFGNDRMAERVVEDHRTRCKCVSNPSSSSLNRALQPHSWHVRYAPTPDEILWENLALPVWVSRLRALVVNIFLFLFLFFLTTPVILVNSLNLIFVQKHIEAFSPVLSQFLPTLLMKVFAVLLLFMVYRSNEMLGHWTRSTQQRSAMKKAYIFLLFMVILLPSFGLTSAQAFVEWASVPRNETFRWECMFLPDNGAFFVNYVITSAFIGTALELVRLPELLMYAGKVAFSRSEAELPAIKKSVLWEFQFGVQYTSFLIIFTMVMIFSVSCPLIVPFGLVYMVLKHGVDRFNIYFIYKPARINQSTHTTATYFVIFSVILTQGIFFAYAFLRRGISPMTYVCLGIFVASGLVFCFQVALDWFRWLSPRAYRRLAKWLITPHMSHHDHVDDPEPFLPGILRTSSSGVASEPLTSGNVPTYGTNSTSNSSLSAPLQPHDTLDPHEPSNRY